ncbi:expressed unknown protein [Seminavis robusta]|uniref:Uncharacterized protein n=1 Tax=Seminavis robusta TaxID=568900 RepID=A0A9N8EQT2_9STRA|nr:expressed unknown protein [Seminavis robusta]|eukprot:Sro1629_g287080.1 n/a (282) ;mRNA; r:5641-6582
MASPSPTDTGSDASSVTSRFLHVERERIKRERQYATKYRRLYSALLSKHEGLLQDAWGGDQRAESCLLDKIWISERNAMATGLVVGCTVLAVLRVIPPVFLRRIGGEEKVQAVRLADEEAKRIGHYKYQRAFAWLVEGGFSLWVGSRAYDYQSKHYSEDAYQTLAKVPLCSGQSIISNRVCDEWVDITTRQIPKDFWKNVDSNSAIYKEMGRIREERAWRAIVQFSNNCVKRRAYERALGAKSTVTGNGGTTEAIDLPTDVPRDIVLSKADAERVVSDSSW